MSPPENCSWAGGRTDSMLFAVATHAGWHNIELMFVVVAVVVMVAICRCWAVVAALADRAAQCTLGNRSCDCNMGSPFQPVVLCADVASIPLTAGWRVPPVATRCTELLTADWVVVQACLLCNASACLADRGLAVWRSPILVELVHDLRRAAFGTSLLHRGLLVRNSMGGQDE